MTWFKGRALRELQAEVEYQREALIRFKGSVVAIPPAPEGPAEMRLGDTGHINLHKWLELRVAAIEDQLGIPHPWDQT